MTWEEARQIFDQELSAEYDKGETSAMFDLAMENITGQAKELFVSRKNNELPGHTEPALRSVIARLKGHEPIQYILKEAWFCGLRFHVNESVLIPRPETEELVEWIISNCRFPVDELAILDVGTGSGCIAISLKRRIRKAVVTGIDISKQALEVAGKNSTELGTPVNFLCIDFLEAAQRQNLGNFDIIVSNPPYIPAGDITALNKNVAQFEPATALFVPDRDPVIFYRALAEFGKTHLTPEGNVYAEMHSDHADRVRDTFDRTGYATEIKKDMQGKMRMIRAWISQPSPRP